MKSFLRKVPLTVGSLALALASLGNLLGAHGTAIRALCGALAALILLVVIAKLLFDRERAGEELKTPLTLSILPNATMAAMVLATYAVPLIGRPALALWVIALCFHILIMLVFFKRYVIGGLDIETITPGWFVACVGITMASITAPAVGMVPVGQIIFYVALALYILALPVVVYRMRAVPLPEPARPALAIFNAPVNLLIAGYLSSFPAPNMRFLYILLCLSLVTYLFVSVHMVSLLRIKFYPTYAAFTFPYVISAVSFRMAHAVLLENGMHFFSIAPLIAAWIAVLIVLYVLIRYTIFLATPSEAPSCVQEIGGSVQ